MEYSNPFLSFYLLFISIFVAIILIEIIDRTNLNQKYFEKTSFKEFLALFALMLFVIEITYQWEINAFEKFNSENNIRTMGLEEYTWKFVWIGSFIEETMKIATMGLLVQLYRKKKFYTIVGVGALFAGIEHYYLLFSESQSDKLIWMRLNTRIESGAQWIHIGLAFMMLSTILICQNKLKDFIIFRYLIYTGVYIASIYIHAYYNYHVFLQTFGQGNENIKYFAWLFIIINVLIYFLILNKFSPVEIDMVERLLKRIFPPLNKIINNKDKKNNYTNSNLIINLKDRRRLTTNFLVHYAINKYGSERVNVKLSKNFNELFGTFDRETGEYSKNMIDNKPIQILVLEEALDVSINLRRYQRIESFNVLIHNIRKLSKYVDDNNNKCGLILVLINCQDFFALNIKSYNAIIDNSASIIVDSDSGVKGKLNIPELNNSILETYIENPFDLALKYRPNESELK